MSHPDTPDVDATASNNSRDDLLWLVGISAVLLLTLLPFSSYVVSLPLIQEEWQMSNTQSGVVFSIYLVGYAISSLIFVPLTDKLSTRRILIMGAAILIASNLLFPILAHNFWVGALLRFIAGAGHVAIYIPGIQLVSKRFGHSRRGTAVGVFVAAGYAGTTLSYTFMGLLLNNTPSWRVAYFLTALIGLLGVFLAFVVTRNAAATTVELAAATTSKRGRLDLSVLKEGSVALVILAYALHTAELYLARLWFPLLLGAAFMREGLSNVEAAASAGTLSGLMFMMGVAGVFLGGALSDRWGRARSAALIFSLSGLCSFVAGWLLDASSLLVGLGFVYGFMLAADSAIYSTTVTEVAPTGRLGSTQAVQSFIGFAVGAVVPVAAGGILDSADSVTGWILAFGFNGVVAVIGVIGLLWLRRLPQAVQMAAGKS